MQFQKKFMSHLTQFPIQHAQNLLSWAVKTKRAQKDKQTIQRTHVKFNCNKTNTILKNSIARNLLCCNYLPLANGMCAPHAFLASKIFRQQFSCKYSILVLIYCHILFFSLRYSFSRSHHKLFDFLSWSHLLVDQTLATDAGARARYCCVSVRFSRLIKRKNVTFLSFIHKKSTEMSPTNKPTKHSTRNEVRVLECGVHTCQKQNKTEKLTRKRYFYSLLIISQPH